MKKNTCNVLICLIFLMTVCCCNNLIAEVIMVGGYDFPPFVEVKKDNVVDGITKQLIIEMNQIQKKYKFKFCLTSPKRRYFDFDQKKYDLIMFEDINWGWKKKNVFASKVFLKGGEVYITKAAPNKNQIYFNNLKNKNIAIIKGYHYGFADFNSNEKFLRDNFKVQFSSYHEGNILKVIFERADISVVNLCYLRQFFYYNPEQKKQIMVSDKFDQQYNHTILARTNAKISIEEINRLLTKMEKAGIISQLACKQDNNN